MKLNQLILIVLGALFISCNNTPPGLNIKGNIQNAGNLTAYFDVKSLSNAIQSLQNEPMEDGSFHFNFPEGLDAGMYRVRIGAKSIDLILNGNESEINIEGHLNTLQDFDYSITGSPMSDKYRQAVNDLINKKADVMSMYQTTVTNEDPLLSAALVLGTSPANPALYEVYNAIGEKLKTQYPSADITRDFNGFAQKMKKNYDMQQSRYRVKVGEPAPEIELPDVNGKTRRLSDLKGQLVLLDFWASWCGPCRRANPKVVELYHKYKDDGFTVFNVSLDGLDERTKRRFPADQLDAQLERSKDRWLDAIKKDNLVWDNHVSDLKKWDSAAAALYGVRSIPTTFLIDQEGTIVAVNPNKNTLESEIKKHI